MPVPALPMDSRVLYLLRHATAASAGETDHARPLAPKGEEEAHALGKYWPAALPWPTCVRCSDAQRTRQTYQHLCSGRATQPEPSALQPLLYQSSLHDMLAVIQSTEAAHPALLIIGHNPTIHEAAAALMQPDDHDNRAGQALHMLYPPCSLTVLTYPASTPWAAITLGMGHLHTHYQPTRGWIF